MIKDMGNMKNGKYRETSKMSDLICENYPMVLVMSRFGIDLGFGEKNIGEVCRQNKIDTYTFLTVVNFLTETETIPAAEIHKDISIFCLLYTSIGGGKYNSENEFSLAIAYIGWFLSK